MEATRRWWPGWRGFAAWSLLASLCGVAGCGKSDDGLVPASSKKPRPAADGGADERDPRADEADDDSESAEGPSEPDDDSAEADGGMGPTARCEAGDEGCECFGNGTCNGTLRCQKEKCRNVEDAPEAECPAGSQGCACYGNETCDGDLRCSDGRCSAGRTPSAGSGGAAGSGNGGSSGAGGKGGSGSGGAGAAAGGTSAEGGSGGAYVPGPDDPCATVLLLLDRSTSMFSTLLPNGGSDEFGAHSDRWEALRGAVAALEPYAGDLAFGAMTYTGFQPGYGTEQCPVVESEAAFALGEFDDILGLIPPSDVAIPSDKGETPTADALEVAYQVLEAVPTDAPKVLMLITDGLPELCQRFDAGSWCGQDPAIGLVQAARARGVTTHVVGIGLGAGELSSFDAEAAEHFLNALAHAGQNRAVAPPAELTADFLTCLYYEYPIYSGASPGADLFNGGWRNYAQASYGPEGTGFAERLHLLPEPDALTSALAQLVESMASCR